MENSIFLDTIKGIKHKRPPVWFMRQAGRILPSYMKLKEKYGFNEIMTNPNLAAEITLLPVKELGVDAAILFTDILVIPDALGMKLTFSDKGPVFENPIKNIENPFKHLKVDTARLEHIYETIDEIIKTKPSNIPLIGFCGAPLTILCYIVQGISMNNNFPDAVNMLYNHRKTAEKLIDAITELSIDYALKQVEHGIDVFQIFETHAGLIPSELYFELIMPAVKKITSAVRDKGINVIFFPKGIGTGITDIDNEITDFISIDWQMSISTARKIVGNDIGLQGNLDPRILTAKQDVISAACEKYIDFGSSETKWIFNLGHGLLPNTPYENVKYVVNWIKSADWKRN